MKIEPMFPSKVLGKDVQLFFCKIIKPRLTL